MALSWHSPGRARIKRGRPFLQLARSLHAVAHDVYCDESCRHVHDGHSCPHVGHSCGCPHSKSYEFEWSPKGETAQRWTDRASVSLLQLISRLDCRGLSIKQIEARLEWWWRGEARGLRRAMESTHRRVCDRGRGVLVNRVTGEVRRSRCKSWRDCDYCAWVYGCAVERLLNQVKRLRAFVVFTMPPERGDWSKKEHIAAQAKAIHRLRERLYRKFARRFSMVWTREHNTHLGGLGRLHLNVAWDIDWLDQHELSQMAEACGFGKVVNIQRIGRDASSITRYVTKCLRYASKDLHTRADWPKGTRRWSASRAARAQMDRPERNPAWYWSPVEPRTIEIEERHYIAPEAPAQHEYWLLPEQWLPTRASRSEGLLARAGPSPPVQLSWPFHTPWPGIP